MKEKSKSISRVTAEQAKRLKDETDYAALDATTDEDIERAVAADPDAAPLDIDWSKARLVPAPGKRMVTMRLDADLLKWFKGQGRGYQTRINAVLRAYKEARENQPR